MAQLPLPPQLSTDPNVNASAMAWAGQLVDALQKIIAGTDGSVAFLRLATPGARKLAYGVNTATYAGGTPAVTVNVTHGLGATPQVVLVTPQVQSGLNAVPANEADTYGATTFRAVFWTIDNQSPVASSTVTFAWLAIG